MPLSLTDFRYHFALSSRQNVENLREKKTEMIVFKSMEINSMNKINVFAAYFGVFVWTKITFIRRRNSMVFFNCALRMDTVRWNIKMGIT